MLFRSLPWAKLIEQLHAPSAAVPLTRNKLQSLPGLMVPGGPTKLTDTDFTPDTASVALAVTTIDAAVLATSMVLGAIASVTSVGGVKSGSDDTDTPLGKPLAVSAAVSYERVLPLASVTATELRGHAPVGLT